ncbi:hypothetical protein RSOL_393650 [Rhizoctonia solani AG-3 Rhs1AP]|uniref:Uncharacterized protein n=1 Tax=Rhizoctonia solani AG-3 Rhs1AP TaxID=1086054 RepID=X8JCM2_9AGAM|nr:hypothetical protein RSOL_393650 [Rhizoctonia solani AG-3 Rhs1AP]
MHPTLRANPFPERLFT